MRVPSFHLSRTPYRSGQLTGGKPAEATQSSSAPTTPQNLTDVFSSGKVSVGDNGHTLSVNAAPNGIHLDHAQDKHAEQKRRRDKKNAAVSRSAPDRVFLSSILPVFLLGIPGCNIQADEGVCTNGIIGPPTNTNYIQRRAPFFPSAVEPI